MRQNARDNLAKFFYDAAKLSLAMLVFGVLVHQPFSWIALAIGIFLTLTLVVLALIIDIAPAKKET